MGKGYSKEVEEVLARCDLTKQDGIDEKDAQLIFTTFGKKVNSTFFNFIVYLKIRFCLATG